MNNQNLTNVDIDSGAIDGTIIGGASPAAGTFTQVTVDGIADTEQLIVRAHGTQNDPLVQLQADDTTPVMDIDSNDYRNVFIGVGAGVNTVIGVFPVTGIDNVFIGSDAGNTNVDGAGNVAIGSGALEDNVDGAANFALGTNALTNNISGNSNTAIGTSSLFNVTTGGQNIAIGNLAGSVTSGSSSGNVFLGYRAGEDEKGSNKLYIDNSDTATPLIYGEFDNNFVKINGTFISKKVVVSKTANYTATTNDEVILCNAASGAFTITLPTAVGNSGLHFTIKKTDATASTVTIATVSAQTIDGTVTKVISNQYDAVKIVSDNANWSII